MFWMNAARRRQNGFRPGRAGLDSKNGTVRRRRAVGKGVFGDKTRSFGKTREKRWFPPGYGRSGTGYGRLRTGHGRFVTGNGWLRTGHGRFVTGNGWLRTGNRRRRTGRCWRQFRRRWWQPPRKSADAGTVGARGGEAIAKLFPKLSLPRNARQNIQDLCRWKMLAWQKGTVFCHPAGGSFGVARQIIMDKGRPPLILSKP